MSMSLRVVVPPHPLIGHWLAVLRDGSTPPPLFATAMAQLGQWLTYEALRDWLPHRSVEIQTPLASASGEVVDPEVPLLVVPVLRAGLGIWQGAQTVLPSARVAHVGLEQRGDARLWFLDALPTSIAGRVGVLVFLPQIATGRTLQEVLERLELLGVEGQRLRVITCLASRPGLQRLAERFSTLTLYCACVDEGLSEGQQIVPGCGDPVERLYGGMTPA